MRIIQIKILFITMLISTFSFSQEPFVVLDYKGNYTKGASPNKNNDFVKNPSHHVKHKIKKGESLSDILKKYYGNSGLNMRMIEVSVLEMNKHAFVRNNPNYMFAGKSLIIPSLNQIMNLVKNIKSIDHSSNTNNQHIYFFNP